MTFIAPALRSLVDGRPATTVDIADRGLAYGDGVFETMAVLANAVPLLRRHLARLSLGCARLGIAAPADALIESELATLLAGVDTGVAKLIVTRGAGARGYAPPRDPPAARIMSLHALPPAAIAPGQGIAVRWCTTTLAINPRLAGIKHLNRLEQVLARAEWHDPTIAEGLVCDAEGRVVGATAANLFAVVSGKLVTPALHRCGVEGVARGLLLEDTSVPVEVRDMLPAELMDASEMFLTSSIRGAMAVTRLDGRSYPLGPATRAAMARFASLGLAVHADGSG